MSTAATVGDQNVLSVNGSVSAGQPVYVGGNEFSMQMDGPASLGRLEVSLDKVIWHAQVTGITDNSVSTPNTRAIWARPALASDASAPRTFRFRFMVFKEN